MSKEVKLFYILLCGALMLVRHVATALKRRLAAFWAGPKSIAVPIHKQERHLP
ncbi:MAG: hypothetical protein HY648_00440 [Acidobacteria bacterium]|nr:hypothetical protein [Acidobacteriota bacterium]